MSLCPKEFYRIERDGHRKEITRRDTDGEEQAFKRGMGRVFQSRKKGENCSTCADSEHGDADDHKGKVIREGDGKYSRKGYFVGETRKRREEDDKKDLLFLHCKIISSLYKGEHRNQSLVMC